MKNWYSEKELKEWLKKQKYSDEISSELAPFLSKHYNLALKKGLESINKWISVEDRLPEGLCLVKTLEPVLGLHIHSANYEKKDIPIIGGRFAWDFSTKVTHWKPLPK